MILSESCWSKTSPGISNKFVEAVKGIGVFWIWTNKSPPNGAQGQ